ncbi:MAG: hypothetical protein LKI39_02765 [Bacteroides sp.]|nr:hypothetical protein [Bacteroides sp.]
MNDYDYGEESVKALVKWAEHTQFPKTMKLSKYENIFDLPRYIEANVNDIKSYYPNVYVEAAITRIYRVKEILGISEQS